MSSYQISSLAQTVLAILDSCPIERVTLTHKGFWKLLTFLIPLYFNFKKKKKCFVNNVVLILSRYFIYNNFQVPTSSTNKRIVAVIGNIKHNFFFRPSFFRFLITYSKPLQTWLFLIFLFNFKTRCKKERFL